eukprot:6439672-Prorocentrum_lima.AAC.1
MAPATPRFGSATPALDPAQDTIYEELYRPFTYRGNPWCPPGTSPVPFTSPGGGDGGPPPPDGG